LLGLSAATLLCGLSWSFVLLASASTGPLAGASLMLAFALGTIPATLSVAGLTRGPLTRVLRWLERRGFPSTAAQLGPKLAAAVLLVLGLVTLFGRASHVPSPHGAMHDASRGAAPGDDAMCHTPGTTQ
jgi:sulfite exporter TauE/SafE